jgi:hypothetical protein
MKKIFLFLMVLSTILACNSTKNSVSAKADEKHFGKKISTTGAVTYDQLLNELNSKDSIKTKVVGKVEGVCQVKGCWMNIVSDEAGKPKMFVKFKDYAFFMPKDIAGRKVIMQGMAYREVTSVEELRHYAEDAGKSAAEIALITKPKEELKFMASGVVLLD